jgi:uroporphyrinogen decarboxylase
MPTRRELVIDQIHHRETQPVPYVLDVEDEVARALDLHWGSPDWRSRIENAIQHVPMSHPDLGIAEWAQGIPHTDLFGSIWVTNGTLTHLEEWPLKEASLKGFTFPPIDSCITHGWEEAVGAEILRNNGQKFLVCGIGFGVFERAWTLRGFDNVLADSAESPAFYQELVEAITDHQMALLDRILDLPIDGIMFSDDWGYQKGVILGPARWRKMIKPCYRRLYDRVHAAGKLTLNHICGSVAAILPDMIEIGLDVYESVQPEAANNSPYELKRSYGKDITFFGGLGAQSMPHYTPDGVKAEIRRLRAEMSAGGGYILAPAKPIPTGTPVAVAAAVVEEFLQD